MAYTTNEKSTGLDVLTTLATGDLHIVGDVSDSGRAKAITEDNLEILIANSATFLSELTTNATFISQSNPLTTKGDIFTYSTTQTRLPVGTNGQVLSADSGEVTGLKWIDMVGGGGGGGTKLAIDTTQSVVGASTTVSMYTVSIPGGTLGTNNAIRYKMLISALANDGGATSTVNIKYGATTINTFTWQVNTASSTGYIEGIIAADGNLAIQKGQAWFAIERGSSSTGDARFHSDYGTAAETSSGNLNLVIEVVTGVGCGITGEGIIVEEIVSTPSIATWLTKPLAPVDAAGTMQLNTNTSMYIGIVDIPHSITVSSITFEVTAVGTTGTLNIALFSEDGQTLYIDQATGSISGAGIVTVATTAQVLRAGNYYLGIHSNSTADITINKLGVIDNAKNLTPVGGAVQVGVATITASTTPSTIDPTTDISASANEYPLIRFDV